MMKEIARYVLVTLLQWEAQLILKKYKPRIVAVTGSVGKTSTKDAVYAVLASRFYVRKSQKSFNSEIGVPLTILGCDNAWRSIARWTSNLWEGFLLIVTKNHYPHWLVLEVGADRPGDISDIASWVTPDISVITCLPDVPVHVEFFDSPEEVAREKWQLAEALSDEGMLVLNNDDARLARRKKYARHKMLTYGFESDANIHASDAQVKEDAENNLCGMRFTVHHGDESTPVTISGALGRQQIYPVLAGFAVGAAQDISLEEMSEAIERYYAPPAGRMRIIAGKNDSTLIDDTYNAAPASVYAALETVRELQPRGKVIVALGDMLELGAYAAAAHRDVGMHVAGVADVFVSVGVRMRYAVEAAHENKMKRSAIHQCGDSKEAGELVSDMLEEGDVVLVKGSQGIRMERVVEACMKDPGQKKELLVRQDAEWSA